VGLGTYKRKCLCVVRGILIALFLRAEVWYMYVLYAEVIRLHFEILTIGTAKLELTYTRHEDKWGVEIQLHSFVTRL